MLAIYTLTRLGQSMYNDLKERGTFDVHIGGVHLPKILYYGDVFLHCVVTALVMYIWVTRPGTPHHPSLTLSLSQTHTHTYLSRTLHF